MHSRSHRQTGVIMGQIYSSEVRHQFCPCLVGLWSTMALSVHDNGKEGEAGVFGLLWGNWEWSFLTFYCFKLLS